jgi:hypothetical protein
VVCSSMSYVVKKPCRRFISPATRHGDVSNIVITRNCESRGTGVGVLGVDEFVDEMVGQVLLGLVVARHALQHVLLVTPVLQHLCSR